MAHLSHPTEQMIASTGLTPRMIAKIRSVVARDSRVERIILFGSRAKGTFREGSDIDLAVHGRAISARDAAKWREELQEQLFPWSVDVVPITNQTDPAILDHIRRVGISLVDKPKEDQSSAPGR